MKIKPRIVITGLGVIAPNGIGIEAFWKTMLAGESGIGLVTLFDVSDLPSRIVGEVKQFDPHQYLDRQLKPRRMGRFTQFALVAARMAFADARLSVEQLQAVNLIPVVMGVSSNAMELAARPPAPYTCISGIPHAAGSAIAYTYGLQSRLLTVSDGCASSLDAVAVAADLIRSEQADIAIAGGADSTMSRFVYESFVLSRKVSQRNDDPAHASRPFDRTRDGGIAAEGAGIVILENAEHALARNARPYGEITGYSSYADSPSAEEGAGLQAAMQMALANAAKRVERIDAISAHAPSDPHFDRYETQLIKAVFGSHAYRLPVTSIKGVTGNPMGTGGVHQLITAALALRHNLLPPTANYRHPDPDCDLDYVTQGARPCRLNTILINTHGFGRGNSCLVLERFQ